MSDADELLKLKELLDSGILTQEEFNKKKDEILGNAKKDEVEESVKEETETKVKVEVESNSTNNEKTKKESKHIGWWVAFVFFAVGTLGSISSSIGEAIIYALITLVCMPTFASWLETKKIKLSTGIRILIIFILITVSGFFNTINVSDRVNTNTNTTATKSTQIEQQVVEQQTDNTNQQSQQNNVVFVPQTNGKEFFDKVLCGVTQYKGLPPQTLKADSLIPYDTTTYMSNSSSTGDSKYSFEVITNTKNEIANIQMFFFNYGKEDPTNYFMAATRLDYPTKDTAKLTDFISKNIGKDEKISIGDFTFHIFNGTSSNCVILDIYTEEWAKINGN